MEKTKVIDKCVNCKKILDEFCKVYSNPASMWMRVGSCPMYTEIVRKVEEKKLLNPIKASKKKAKK